MARKTDTALPKEFKLGGYTYQVKEAEGGEIAKVVGMEEDSAPYGAINPDEQTIYVRRDMTPQMKSVTLAHEITHAIMFNNNIGRLEPDEKNEDLVDRMGMGIVEVIRRNPEIVSYITKLK